MLLTVEGNALVCESSDMSPRPRTHFLCCIPVQGAVTALGYFQASLTVVGILYTIREIVLELCRYIRFVPYDGGHYDFMYMKLMSLLVLPLEALCLTLAVLLLVGVKKRGSDRVLTYLVLGMAADLYLAVSWVDHVSKYTHFHVSDGHIERFLVLIVYSLFLVMVYFEHRNIKLEKESNNATYNALQKSDYNGSDIKVKDIV